MRRSSKSGAVKCAPESEGKGGIQTQPMVKTLSLDSGCVGVELLFVELEETDRKTWIAGRAEAPAFRPLFRLTYGMMS